MKLYLDIDVRKTGTGDAQAQAAVRGLTTVAGSATAAFTKLAGAIAGAYAIDRIVRGMVGLVQQGLEFNSRMEQSRLSLAAIATSFGEITDAQGHALQGVDKFNAGLRIAKGLQDELRVAALKTVETYSDLERALQVAFAPALRAGFSTDQLIPFVQRASQAAGAIGVGGAQLPQEIRSLLEGDIGPDSRLANIVFGDLPRDNIKGFVRELAEAGKLFDYVMPKLEGFAIAGEDLANTFGGATSNLKDAIEQMLGAGTQSILDDMTQHVKDLTAEIVTFNADGQPVFNQDAIDGMRAMSNLIAGTAKEAVDLAKALDDVSVYAQAVRDTFRDMNFLNKEGSNSGSGLLMGISPIIGILRTLTSDEVDDRIARLQKSRRAAAYERPADDVLMEELMTTGRVASLDAAGKLSAPSRRGPTDAEIRAAEQLRKETEKQNDTLAQILERNQRLLRDLSERDELQRKLNGVEDEYLDKVAKIEQLTRTTTESRRDALALARELANAQKAELVIAEILAANAETLKALDEGVIEHRKKQVESIEMSGEIAARVIDRLVDEKEKANRRELELERRKAEEMRRLYSDMGNVAARSTYDAFQQMFGGEDALEIFTNFADGMREVWSANLADMVGEWFDNLGRMASGQANAQGVTPTSGQQQGAQIAFAGMNAALAGYQILNQQGATKTQNIVGGISTGASVGAAIGSVIPVLGTAVGAIIGALLGAVLGAFAQTADKVGFNIGVTGGRIVLVTGVGDAKSRQVEQALRDVNAALAKAKDSAGSVIDAFPSSVVEALGAGVDAAAGNINIRRLIEATKSSTDAFRDFLEIQLPQAVFDAYAPIFKAGLAELGVTQKRIDEIFKGFANIDPKELFGKLREYVEAIVGFQEAIAFLGKSSEEKFGLARSEVSKTVPQRMAEINDAISELANGFGDLTHDEQVSRAKEILTLTDERYRMELQYLEQIRQLQEAITKSIDDQIFDIQQTQRSPEEQIDALLGRQRSLRDMLESATTPEAIQQIVAEMQRNASILYNLMGNTPEAANQIVAMLEEIRGIAADRFAALVDEIEASDKLLQDVLTQTLDFFTTFNEEIGGIIDGIDDIDLDPIRDMPDAVKQANDALLTFRDNLLQFPPMIGGNSVPSVVVNNYGDASSLLAHTEVMVDGRVSRMAMRTARKAGGAL